jgi:hypothetical protein
MLTSIGIMAESDNSVWTIPLKKSFGGDLLVLARTVNTNTLADIENLGLVGGF